MTDFSLDKTGNARLALEEVFRDYGLAGIDDDKLLGQMLPDLLPGAPRETNLLQAAAAARAGRLLIDRIDASIPTEAAVRDVAAMLTERTALDATACLWVVAEYAHAIGYPVDVSPPDASGGPSGAGGDGAGRTGGSGGTGGPGDGAGTRYTPGRYAPRPPGIEETTIDPNTVVARRSNRFLLVMGVIVAVVVLGAGAAIAVTAWPSAKCVGAACQATPSPSDSITFSPTTFSPTPPSPTPTVTVTTGTIVPALRTVMPHDINVTNCNLRVDHSFLTGVTSSYACTEGNSSDMPGMQVWGYQFDSPASLAVAVGEFNRYINFDTGKAGDRCPPSTSGGGYTTWHRQDKPNDVLGQFECYVDHNGGHDYLWTDYAEYTIIVAATTRSQSFARLDSWWVDNNYNSPDG